MNKHLTNNEPPKHKNFITTQNNERQKNRLRLGGW